MNKKKQSKHSKTDGRHSRLLSRLVYLNGTINEDSAQQCIQGLFGLSKVNSEPILLVINSMGGSIADMFAVHDAIRILPCPIYTLVLGRAYSAAAVLTIMMPSGRRFITPHSTMMIHRIRSGARGSLDDMQNHIQRDFAIQKRIARDVLKNTNLKKQMKRLMEKEHIIKAKDAVKYGMVDGVIDDMNQILKRSSPR